MEHFWVCDAHICCLQVQEVKEVLDWLGNSCATWNSEECLKELINIWLEDPLNKELLIKSYLIINNPVEIYFKLRNIKKRSPKWQYDINRFVMLQKYKHVLYIHIHIHILLFLSSIYVSNSFLCSTQRPVVLSFEKHLFVLLY